MNKSGSHLKHPDKFTLISSYVKEIISVMKLRSVFKIRTRYALKNYSAFTLIEMMINLSIVLVILFIIPMIYMQLSQLNGKSVNHFDINCAMFLRELSTELKTSGTVEINGDQLILTKNENQLSYTFHKGRIVRKVNNEGYVIMLEGIKEGVFTIEDKHLYVTIQSIYKQKKEKFLLL